MDNGLLREIPKVDELIKIMGTVADLKAASKEVITSAARQATEEARQEILAGKNFSSKELLLSQVYDRCGELIKHTYKPLLRPVINATGVVLHTNLGRAVLSHEATQAVQNVSKGYCNLEMELEQGIRGSRFSHVEELLLRLTGAESCLVVNNNAAAVLLALTALAKDKEVVVSRGQLVEIGGAFRIPEVMKQSGAKLVEVGTTNKTHLVDYEKALTPETALFLKVHTSNFVITGFTHTTSSKELGQLGNKYQIPVMEDLGSGSLIKFPGLNAEEPTVQEVLGEGVDILTFSGDKLLGGPQAGIIVGKKKYLDLMKNHPLQRALRVDKFTIAALEATLRQYLDMEKAQSNIPTLEMLTRPTKTLHHQAQKLAGMLKIALGETELVVVREGFSEAGGGSLPGVELTTWLVYVKSTILSVGDLAEKLRLGEPSIMVRIQDDSLVLDPRTLLNTKEYQHITSSLTRILSEGGR